MKQVHRGGAFLLLGLIALGGGSSLQAQELTQALTAAQVGCNDDQLERLLYRSHLAPIRAGKLHTLFVAYNELSLYEGLGVARPDPERGGNTESYLAFHLNPDVRPHLLNPQRLPLGQISLTREEPSSNLVPPLVQDAMALQVNPLAVVAGNPPWSEPGVLRINNFLIPAAGSPYTGHQTSDVKPGRGLEQDGLLTVCHTNFTAFDRWVLSLLQRMLVVTANTFVGPAVTANYDTEVAIFRDQDPHTYRIHVYAGAVPATPDTHRFAARLRVDWTPDGRLTTGRLEMLPRCTGPGQEDCTTTINVEEIRLFLAPPILGGTGPRPFPWYGFVYNTALGNPFGPLVADIDFADLLSETAWNSGGWVVPGS